MSRATATQSLVQSHKPRGRLRAFTSSGVSPALRSCFTLRILFWLFGSAFQWREDMTIGVGNLVAIVCIVISIIFAIVTNQATNALWWALLAIFAVLWWGARAPWGTS